MVSKRHECWNTSASSPYMWRILGRKCEKIWCSTVDWWSEFRKKSILYAVWRWPEKLYRDEICKCKSQNMKISFSNFFLKMIVRASLAHIVNNFKVQFPPNFTDDIHQIQTITAFIRSNKDIPLIFTKV